MKEVIFNQGAEKHKIWIMSYSLLQQFGKCIEHNFRALFDDFYKGGEELPCLKIIIMGILLILLRRKENLQTRVTEV